MSAEVREAISEAISKTILDETDDTIPCCNNCKYNRPSSRDVSNVTENQVTYGRLNNGSNKT